MSVECPFIALENIFRDYRVILIEYCEVKLLLPHAPL